MDSEEPIRYERGGMPSPADLFAAMRRGATKPGRTPFFQNADSSKTQQVTNAVDEAAAKVAMQQAMNAHVRDHFRREAQTRAGGTLAQGRSYPMRVGGRHSDEMNSQLNGECSDAGRRLNECKEDGRHSKESSAGMRL